MEPRQPGVSGNGANQEDQDALRQGGLRPVQVVGLRFTAVKTAALKPHPKTKKGLPLSASR